MSYTKADFMKKINKKIAEERKRKAYVVLKSINKFYNDMVTNLHMNKKYTKQINKSQSNINHIIITNSILIYFPNLINNQTAELFISINSRITGFQKKRKSWSKNLSILNKISRDFNTAILPYTGINLIVDNIPNYNMTTMELYNVINDITPVVFSWFVSPQTAFICCLSNTAAKQLAIKMNNMVMCDSTTISHSFKPEEYIKSFYIKPIYINRSYVYDWNTKSQIICYSNNVANIIEPLNHIVEYSSMMKERP